MQVQLYHNPKSGNGECKTQQLARRIEEAGHRVVLKSLFDEPDDDYCDVVAIAGGDGTVEKVVRRHYRTLTARGIPISILPVGTANNIARSLGISRQPKWLDSRAEDLDLKKIDKKLSVGIAVESAGERYFVESVGCGALAELIRKKDHPWGAGNLNPGNSAHQHIASIQTLVQEMEACDCEVIIDGREYSNRYLVMEVMNTNRAGPGLELAPDADPGDPFFRVVLIASAEKDLLIDYLNDVLRGASPENPFFRVTGRRVEFSCGGRVNIHVDDACLYNSSQCRFGIQAGSDPLLVVD